MLNVRDESSLLTIGPKRTCQAMHMPYRCLSARRWGRLLLRRQAMRLFGLWSRSCDHLLGEWRERWDGKGSDHCIAFGIRRSVWGCWFWSGFAKPNDPFKVNSGQMGWLARKGGVGLERIKNMHSERAFVSFPTRPYYEHLTTAYQHPFPLPQTPHQ